MKLTKKEKDIIEEFKKRIIEKFSHEILKVSVFGSKARGDATAESDIDIMVVVRSDDWRLWDKIREVGYELELENSLVLSIQVFSQEQIEYLQKIETAFMVNVEREAIAI